ncbi:hypothetical protein V6N13_068361 [Hibiscus sabdariffa]|uniref:Uncharacterized protein n=1 Tax=Hibiscus sabdariffa TaxID=183260 RepID=A0ABR2QMF6_9ROSI
MQSSVFNHNNLYEFKSDLHDEVRYQNLFEVRRLRTSGGKNYCTDENNTGTVTLLSLFQLVNMAQVGLERFSLQNLYLFKDIVPSTIWNLSSPPQKFYITNVKHCS